MTVESSTIQKIWPQGYKYISLLTYKNITYGTEIISNSTPKPKKQMYLPVEYLYFAYCRIIVTDEINSRYCITIEAGKSLYECLIVKLRHGQRVVLDFAGVEDITAPFLNTAIGDLLEHYSLKQLQDTLKTENLSELDREMLEDILVEFDRYYRDPGFRQAVDKPFEGFNEAEAWL